MLFTIVRSPIFKPNLLLSLVIGRRDLVNLDQEKLMQLLKNYETIYLTSSLEEAKEIADTFYHEDRFPKVSGSFGLIIQVQVKIAEIPEEIAFNSCEFFNEWIKQQPLNYTKHEAQKEIIGYKIAPEQLTCIDAAIVPEAISSMYPGLQSEEFQVSVSKCSIM
ncbi:MAG: hypothetical protein Q8M03_12040 [Legionella sp.]|nr:hypothetical protein [Legionella sp.]